MSKGKAVKAVGKSRSKKRSKTPAVIPGVAEAELLAAQGVGALASAAPAVDAETDASPLPPPPRAQEEKWLPPVGPPPVPSVWRDAGYLALVVSFRDGQVSYISSSEGGVSHRMSLPTFWSHVRPTLQVVEPIRCALSFLTRERSGLFNLRVRDVRRLVEMITREELDKLSERELGEQYRKLVDPKGPQRVKADKKSDYIDKILVAAKEMGAKVEASESASAAPQKEKKAKAPKAPKEPKAAKPPKEPKPPKEKKAKEPKPPKPPKEKKPSAKEVKAAGGNPFREGSMKHKAFAVYLSSKGDRAKTVEAATKAGATASTASSWYNAFNKL